MNKEELIKATILGEEHLGENLKGLCIEYIDNLQQENQKYKEVFDKAIKHVSSLSSKGRDCRIYANVKKDILDILKEVE